MEHSSHDGLIHLTSLNYKMSTVANGKCNILLQESSFSTEEHHRQGRQKQYEQYGGLRICQILHKDDELVYFTAWETGVVQT